MCSSDLKIVETHPISKRLALRRGKQGFTCARAFHFYKTEVKTILGGGCSCKQMAIESLLSSILNKREQFRYDIMDL